MYGWSKWGGANKGLEYGSKNGNWHCQICGEEQPAELRPYFFPLDKELRNFLRICINCQHKVMKFNIHRVDRLIDMVRPYKLFG